MFHNNIVKISEKNEQAELVVNLPQVIYLTAFYIRWFDFYNGKIENIWFKKND